MTLTYPPIRITQAELLAEATLRFGDDPLQFAFRCPHCGDVAKLAEFKDLDVDPGYCGQECIGRHMGALSKALGGVDEYRKGGGRGCDWVSYGLFRGPWEIVLPAEGDKPERSMWGFPLAGAPAADGPVARLAATQEATR